MLLTISFLFPSSVSHIWSKELHHHVSHSLKSHRHNLTIPAVVRWVLEYGRPLSSMCVCVCVWSGGGRRGGHTLSTPGREKLIFTTFGIGFNISLRCQRRENWGSHPPSRRVPQPWLPTTSTTQSARRFEKRTAGKCPSCSRPEWIVFHHTLFRLIIWFLLSFTLTGKK